MLLERLDAVASETGPAAADSKAVIELAIDVAGDTIDSLIESVEVTPQMPQGVAQGISAFFEPRGWEGTGWLIAAILLAILAGLVCEFVIDLIARRWRHRIQNETPDGLAATLGLLLRRAVLDVAGLIAFYIVTKQPSEARSSVDGCLQRSADASRL